MTFGDRELQTLWLMGQSRKIKADLHRRALRALTALEVAVHLREVDPSFRLHPLVGTRPLRHSMWVGPTWRITFVASHDAVDDLRLEQYH